MCTLVLLRRPDHDWPVLIGANRDEMINRAWQKPARHWPDRAETVGGLDVLAGGSWLAVNEHGVVAGILNRVGTLGPQSGKRSRGELVLEALDHADAASAADALTALEAGSYRPFNLILADNRDAFWLRHADPTGTLPVTASPLPTGLSMITAGDLDDDASPRIERYMPRFAAAPVPDPDRDDWRSWETLLGDDVSDSPDEPNRAMNFATARGFATVSSAFIALPAVHRQGVRPILRFLTRRPEASAWEHIPV